MMNKHNERAEFAQGLRDMADEHQERGAIYKAQFLRQAAALLEAQPAEQVKGREAVGWISAGGLRELSEQGRAEIFAKKDYECIGTAPLYTTPPAQHARECTEPQMAEIALQLMELRGVERLVWGDMASVAQGRLLTPNAESKLRGKNAGL